MQSYGVSFCFVLFFFSWACLTDTGGAVVVYVVLVSVMLVEQRGGVVVVIVGDSRGRALEGCERRRSVADAV